MCPDVLCAMRSRWAPAMHRLWATPGVRWPGGTLLRPAELCQPSVIVPSMWPRWVGGRTVHPAACCSASPPMGGRLELGPGPMRAGRPGLESRVGLFSPRGGQQSAPSLADGCVSVMVTLPSFSSTADVGTNPRSRRPRVSGQLSRCSGVKVTGDFDGIIASELSGTLLIVPVSEPL